MKAASTLALGVALLLWGCGGESVTDEPESPTAPVATTPEAISPVVEAVTGQQMTVEVGCASCIYQMAGVEGCSTLAAKIDGQPLHVSGVELDLHELGLCSAPKQAKLVAKVDGDSVVASQVEVQ